MFPTDLNLQFQHCHAPQPLEVLPGCQNIQQGMHTQRPRSRHLGKSIWCRLPCIASDAFIQSREPSSVTLGSVIPPARGTFWHRLTSASEARCLGSHEHEVSEITAGRQDLVSVRRSVPMSSTSGQEAAQGGPAEAVEDTVSSSRESGSSISPTSFFAITLLAIFCKLCKKSAPPRSISSFRSLSLSNSNFQPSI